MDSDDDDEPPLLIDVTTQSAPPLTNETEMEGGEPVDTHINLAPCPVTILSGFLGSGKTTLIQYILKSPDHGKRIAVIENEFGEGLAVETLIARDGVDPNSNSLQDFIELPNGCICCTVKDSLVATLENLVEQKRDLDYILIEASGMANPGPIASVFWLDDALESRLQLDGIVTLVDAHNILHQLESTEEAAQQVAYADRLLVNKTDLLKSPAELEAVTAALRKLHPTAPIQTTTFAKVPNLNWILSADCFGGAARLQELNKIWEQAVTHTGQNQARHDHVVNQQLFLPEDLKNPSLDQLHSHEHGVNCAACALERERQEQGHRHTAAVTTVALQRKGSLSLQKLNAWLAELLWPHQDETNKVLTAALKDQKRREEFLHKRQESAKGVMQLFRVKGIVSVEHRTDDLLLMDQAEIDKFLEPAVETKTDSSGATLSWQRDRRRYIVQAVHDLWEVHAASDDLQFTPNEEREGKIVIIGRYLPKKTLEDGFAACFV